MWFFMDNIISFEEWLNMNDWENPSNGNYDKPILQILSQSNGNIYIKYKLRWLPFFNRPDGN